MRKPIQYRNPASRLRDFTIRTARRAVLLPAATVGSAPASEERPADLIDFTGDGLPYAYGLHDYTSHERFYHA